MFWRRSINALSTKIHLKDTYLCLIGKDKYDNHKMLKKELLLYSAGYLLVLPDKNL